MANLRITRLGHGGVLYRSPNDAWVWVDRQLREETDSEVIALAPGETWEAEA